MAITKLGQPFRDFIENHINIGQAGIDPNDGTASASEVSKGYIDLADKVDEIIDALETLNLSGVFVGSADTYADLPSAENQGDWAVLRQDDGGNESGIYTWDGSQWVFTMDITVFSEVQEALEEIKVLDDVNSNGGYLQFLNEDGQVMAQISFADLKNNLNIKEGLWDLATNGTDLRTDKKVGIGTDDPKRTLSALSINGEAVVALFQSLNSTGAYVDVEALNPTANSGFRFLKNGSTITQFLYDNDNDVVKLQKNGGSFFAIKGDFIGIGTNDPTAGLDVAYGARVRELPDATNNATYTKRIVADDDGNFASKPIARPLETTFDNYPNFVIQDSDNNEGQIEASDGVANAIQRATEAQINTMFNALNGAYVGLSQIVVNSIFPPVIESTGSNTETLTLYGSGLNITPDPLIQNTVRIYDVNDDTYTEVGYNVISDNRMEIIVPDNLVQVGHSYKVEIVSGVQRHVSLFSFDVVASLTKVDFSDNLWTENIYDQTLYDNADPLQIVQGVISGVDNPLGDGTLDDIFYNNSSYPVHSSLSLDLSAVIGNNDNFAISFTLEQPLRNRRNNSLYFTLRDSLESFGGTNLTSSGGIWIKEKTNTIQLGSCFDNSTRSMGAVFNTAFPFSYIGQHSPITFTITRKNGIYQVVNSIGQYVIKESILIQNLVIDVLNQANANEFLKINRIVKW